MGLAQVLMGTMFRRVILLLCLGTSTSEAATIKDLVSALESAAVEMETSPAVRQSYEELLEVSPVRPDYREFVRVRMLFEAAREAGTWRIRWTVTDQEPESDRIWKQWMGRTDFAGDGPTADAECDELSALFAFLARRLKVQHAGLFWPTRDHAIAVWTVHDGDEIARINVPTSQVYLHEFATLGDRSFDPYKQKRIYDYTRADLPDTAVISEGLLAFLVAGARATNRPTKDLDRDRIARRRE